MDADFEVLSDPVAWDALADAYLEENEEYFATGARVMAAALRALVEAQGGQANSIEWTHWKEDWSEAIGVTGYDRPVLWRAGTLELLDQEEWNEWENEDDGTQWAVGAEAGGNKWVQLWVVALHNRPGVGSFVDILDKPGVTAEDALDELLEATAYGEIPGEVTHAQIFPSGATEADAGHWYRRTKDGERWEFIS